jgi:hypothetical protein
LGLKSGKPAGGAMQGFGSGIVSGLTSGRGSEGVDDHLTRCVSVH